MRQLDPARFLGERGELPPAANPGDWCTVTVHDDLSAMRWTLLARELGRTTSIFAERRGESLGNALGPRPRAKAERIAEQGGLTASAPPARMGEGTEVTELAEESVRARR
jgi:hypothetical protein